MVLGCLGRIHQPAHKSPNKERHTSTDKERKERGQAPFFPPSDEVLFAQGGCRALSGTDGWGEELMEEGRVREREG